MKSSILAIAFIAVCAFFLFFFRLGDIGLTDPDEAFYAQTAKEMLQRGEWMTPYLLGKPQFEKPVLFYWLVEGSFAIFGVNEFAARLPSAILGLVGLLAVYLIGSALFTKRAGILSALVAASSIEYIALARACVTDMALAVFLALAFLFFVYGYKGRPGGCYLLSAAFIALAVLTKGPVGVLLGAAVIFLFLLVNRDLAALRKIPVLASVAIFLALALPWYILMHKIHGKAFMDEFFGFHNVARFLSPEHEWGQGPFYNIPVVFAGLFPWSVFLPIGFWRSVKEAFKPKAEACWGNRFLLVWFFTFFLFFSLSSTKLPTYVFPAFFPAVIFIGSAWSGLLGSGSSGPVRAMKVSQIVLLGAVIITAVTAYILLSARYRGLVDPKGTLAAGIIFIALTALSSHNLFAGRYMRSFLLIVTSVAATLVLFGHFVLPAIETHETSTVIAGKLKTLMKPDEEIGSESHFIRGIAFYTGKIPVDLDKHHILVRFLESKRRVWCVLKEKNHVQLYTLDTEPFLMRPTYLVWRLGKKCIVTNVVPDDGAYIVRRDRVQ